MFVYTGNKLCRVDSPYSLESKAESISLIQCWLDNHCWFINILPPNFNAENIGSPTAPENSFVLWYSVL